jgi:hypothetical protein
MSSFLRGFETKVIMENWIIFGVTTAIVGIPPSVYLHQVIQGRTLKGFFLGLGLIPLLLAGGYLLLAVISNFICGSDQLHCEWIPLSFILWLGASAFSIICLLITAPLLKVSFSLLSKHRYIRSNRRIWVICISPLLVSALMIFLVIYTNFLSTGTSLLFLAKLVGISFWISCVITIMFVISFFSLSSKYILKGEDDE